MLFRAKWHHITSSLVRKCDSRNTGSTIIHPFQFYPHSLISLFHTSPSLLLIPSQLFFLPVTKGSPLLCSGCLPPWFARCSARICIGWPTCRFSPPPFPFSPTLPSSHHLCLASPEPALILSFSLALFSILSFSCSSLITHSPHPPLHLAPSPAVSHFHILFFLPGFSLFFICLQICLFLLWSNTKSYQSGSLWVNKPDHFSSQGTLEKKRRKSRRKSQTNIGSKLKDGDKARVGIFTLRWDSVAELWGRRECVTSETIKRQKADSLCVPECVELLVSLAFPFSISPSSLVSQPRLCILSVAWQSGAVQSRTKQSERADRCSAGWSPCCHSLCICKWRRARRDAFQVLLAKACIHSVCSCSHTRARYMVIKGAATGQSYWEQKVKTYWILVQRASKQAKNSRRSAACQRVESKRWAWAAFCLNCWILHWQGACVDFSLPWSLPLFPGYGKVTFSEILAHLLYSILNNQ